MVGLIINTWFWVVMYVIGGALMVWAFGQMCQAIGAFYRWLKRGVVAIFGALAALVVALAKGCNYVKL